MSILGGIFPSRSEREVRKLRAVVEEINKLEPTIHGLSDTDLSKKTAYFKAQLAEGKTLDHILPEAFAVVREASARTLKQRHHDVQLIGGMILHHGAIAEMKTGEGKTLMATLAVYLNALSGKGVHVVTVNDYLARRDATWMGQIYHFLGLSVGIINDNAAYIFDPSLIPEPIMQQDEKDEQQEGSFRVGYEFLQPSTKRQAYHADITYGTNNQFGFDYLRDNIEHNPNELRQREFNFAIVDEVDSILIDEARTPLIISAPTVDSESLYVTFADIANKMEEGKHYTKDEKFKSIALSEEGIDLAESLLGVSNIYTEGGIKYVHHLETAVRAKAHYHIDVEYIVKDNQVIIVDPSTGRLQPGRRWSEGLHQAIEAKEGVTIQQESRTYASITFQNYFRMYPKLAGMTGTGMTSAEEFLKVYGLDVIEVPTNKAIIRIDQNDLIFQNEKGKFTAITRKIKELHEKGQPVLIGTVSIEKNQLLSDALKKAGIPHSLLNAKPEFAEKEGETVAQAGKKGAVTIATNMAGRGVDIKLGGALGTAETADEIRKLGGLFVLGTERHEARRIDNQLRGRSGRQGDPGETQFFVSLEDDLMRIFANDTVKNMMARLKIPEDEPIQHSMISRALESAQRKIEGLHFDSRRQVLEYDDVLNQQRLKVYDRRKKILLGDINTVREVLNAVTAKATPEERAAIDQKKMQFAEANKAIGAALSAASAVSATSAVPAASATPEAPAQQAAPAEAPKEHLKTAAEILASDDMPETSTPQIDDRAFLATARGVMLQTIDLFWIDHLEFMDYLRSSVNLRAYGQRDPLVEYKREGLKLFREMEQGVDNEIIRILQNVQGQVGLGHNNVTVELRGQPSDITGSGVSNVDLPGSALATTNPSSASDATNAAKAIVAAAPVGTFADDGRIGRNDQCPCGSGKKWKKCGMLNTLEHQRNMEKK